MKKFFYLLIVSCFFAVPAHATHLMGGELTATHIGGYDYEVNLTVYRDTLGIPIYTTAMFEVLDASGVSILTETADVDPASGGLLPLFPYGVEEYFYKDTITMPGPGSFTIGWSTCCRNGAIINATDPLSESMYLFCNIEVFDPAVAVNNSPVFLNGPVTFMPIGMPWSYNPLPFDADGDSLVWSITTPLDDYGSTIDGYTDPSGDPADPFSIDPLTGTITWTPNMLGNFVTSIAVDEYRGGVNIGRIVRDMQLIVVDSMSALAKFDNLNSLPTNDEGYYFDELSVGTPYSLSLLASDPDLTDVLNMEATGAPFLLPTNPSTFSFAPTGVDNNIEGTFNWTPDVDAVSDDDYIVVFRLDDGIFATDLTILYRVSGGGSSTGIETIPNAFNATLSPNPATGPVMLSMELETAGTTNIYLYSADGKRLKDWNMNLPSGQNRLVLNEQLSQGQYYVVIENNNRRQTLPLVVSQ